MPAHLGAVYTLVVLVVFLVARRAMRDGDTAAAWLLAVLSMTVGVVGVFWATDHIYQT